MKIVCCWITSRSRLLFSLTVVTCLLFSGCSSPIQPPSMGDNATLQPASESAVDTAATEGDKNEKSPTGEGLEVRMETATFGNGCYWCTEAVFQRVEGVQEVVSGFSGGHIDNPSYEAVCTGTTGHAEVLQIKFDPTVVSFEKLLEVFWSTHDPTTLNRQGNDIGTQYRSAVFYHSDTQRELAEKYKQRLDESGAFDDPIVTEITAFDKFYPAPAKHQNYYNENKDNNPYCRMITYKLEKFRKAFADVIDKDKDVVK